MFFFLTELIQGELRILLVPAPEWVVLLACPGTAAGNLPGKQLPSWWLFALLPCSMNWVGKLGPFINCLAADIGNTWGKHDSAAVSTITVFCFSVPSFFFPPLFVALLSSVSIFYLNVNVQCQLRSIQGLRRPLHSPHFKVTFKNKKSIKGETQNSLCMDFSLNKV